MNLLIVDRDEDDEEDSKKKNDEENKNKDKDKKNKNEPKPFDQWIKLLYKTYLISIIQLALIEIFLILGFNFELNNVFTKNLGSMLGIFFQFLLFVESFLSFSFYLL